MGYDVNNTTGRIAGDLVRKNRERAWGLVGLRARQDFADPIDMVSENLMSFPLPDDFR